MVKIKEHARRVHHAARKGWHKLHGGLCRRVHPGRTHKEWEKTQS